MEPKSASTSGRKRSHSSRKHGLSSGKQRAKSESRSVVRKPKGSTGISGRCRSDGSMIVKGNWTDQEDGKLVNLVLQNFDIKGDPKGIASTRWSEIAKELPGRVGKQCRERWHNHLRPDINKGQWTFLEEVAIYLCWRSWNSQWARISRILEGRSDNRVKNHWNCHMKRRLHRDPAYYQFMEDCAADIIPRVDFTCEDDFDDALFRGDLLPKIKQFLTENKNSLDQLPLFASGAKRESFANPTSSTSAGHRLSFPNMTSILQTPTVESLKRTTKELKTRAKRQRRDSGQTRQPTAHTTPAWLIRSSLQSLGDGSVENDFLRRGLEGSPESYYGSYATLNPGGYVSVKQEMDLMGPDGIGGSPPGHHYYYPSDHGYRSPIESCAAELTVGENDPQEPVVYGDPLWSRAVSAEYSAGSPIYFHRAGTATLTSTPLKGSSSFNVPLAVECGAVSPYLGLRHQFPGFHSSDDALLSPIRRSFCGETSMIDDSLWSPSKMSHTTRWTPVKLGSIVCGIKTPQAIREALASSEINRSRISPEDLASPSRLFSDASELIDGEMNQSQGRDRLAQFSTPEPIVKCRRRLTDQWSSFGTPSFSTSSGYDSFHTTPGGHL